MRLLLAIATLALLGVGPAAATTAGLHGVVTRSPTTPSCAAEDPCSEPAVHTTIVFVRNGLRHAVVTDSLGHYSIALAPGVYRVLIPGARFGYEPHGVTVAAGRRGRFDVDIDTGIR